MTETVGTLDELTTLPPQTIIMDSEGIACCRDPYGVNDKPIWYPAWLVGDHYSQDFGWKPDEIALPAEVLYRPEPS